MKKINECSPLEEVEIIVRLSDVQIKKTTTDVDYASMIAFDGQDKIEAKMWKFSDELRNKLVNGEVYRAVGRMKEYQGKLQFNISDIEQVTSALEQDEQIDLSIFYETAKYDSKTLAKLINEYYLKITNEKLKNIVSVLLTKHFDKFFNYPAAKSMHHNYYGGLAYHTYCMLKLSDAFIELYDFINRDLVYAGIIIHDIGKIIELSGPKGTEYTKSGTLLGHISIGANEIYCVAKDLGYENSEEVLNLLHIVLSHHGKLEYGSPKEPLTVEAYVVHLVDLSDSKLAGMESEVKKVQKGEYTSPIVSSDRKTFYIPNIE